MTCPRPLLGLLLGAVLLGAAACATPNGGAPSSATATLRPIDLQGHRGARGLLPENTIPGFRRALELGVNTLEMDVVVTADDRVVVSHEPWFSAAICTKPDGTPVTEAEEHDLNIYQMTADEVAAYDCGLRGNPRFAEQQKTPATKPLLDDVLTMAEAWADAAGAPPVLYNVEIKSKPERDGRYHPAPDVYAQMVYDVVVAQGVLDRTTLQSFDPRALEAVHALDASATTALLVDNDDGFAANLARLTFRPDIYSPHHRLVDAALIEAAHARGLQVIPWTVNEEADMRRLLDLSVDGLITDYPDRGRRLLDARPAPSPNQP